MPEDTPLHPGKLLKERFLDPLDITPWALSRAIGVQVGRITALIRGERALTPDTAARLGRFFQVPALWFLEAQARWDAAVAEEDETILRTVVPFSRLDEVIVTPRGAVPVRKVEKSRPMKPLMVSSTHSLPVAAEGTKVVAYPNGMVGLEHR